MTPVKTTTKRSSQEGSECASSNKSSLFPVKSQNRAKIEWCRVHELWIGTLADGTKRAITPVVTAESLHWMDCITGSFYHHLTDVRRNQIIAEEILMAAGIEKEEKSVPPEIVEDEQ